MPAFDGLNKRVVRLEAEYKPLLEQSGHIVYGFDTSNMTAEERKTFQSLSTPPAERYLAKNGRMPRDLTELTRIMTSGELSELKQFALSCNPRLAGNEGQHP